MRFVYATGQPRNLNFAIAGQREGVPSNAEVYAVCDGERTVHQLGEQTFNAMTDEEYLTLQELINKSEQAEASGAHLVSCSSSGLLRRLIRRITAALL